MSERRDIQEAILKNWANLGYITSSRINDQLFLDDESLDCTVLDLVDNFACYT